MFRILKNDLKRKKTMNVILFLFIILATMFVSSGINNVATIINGTDYYLDKANIGDFIIITMGDNAVGSLDKMLETENAVKDYRKECVVFGAQDNVTTENGSSVKCKNSIIYQSIKTSVIHFFNIKNEKVTNVDPGHIYVSGDFMKDNGFEIGDIICLKHSGLKMSFILDGMVKDALLGSEFMGNTRFILNDKDMQKLFNNEVIYNHYRGEICYIDTDDLQAMKSAMSDVSNVAFDGTRSTIKMCYVMDMILAFVILILSICLIIVSFIVLKFSITFTIMEEFREIGVMKAIGLSNMKIRSLYIIKYLILAIVGSTIGFIASIPFGNLLLESASQKMVLGHDNTMLMNLLGSLLVVGVIVLFAYLCTGKVKKSSPVDAIHNGQTGERYKNKSVLRIHQYPINNAFFMAFNDILSHPKRFMTIMISFGICTLFVLIMVNTTATFKSPNLISTLGKESHLYVTDVADVMNYMNTSSKSDMKKKLNKMADELNEKGIPSQLCIELQYKYPMTFNGNKYVLSCQQGLNTKMTDYVYTKGVIPQNNHEIAITPQISEMTGAKIGDIITIHYGEKDVDCMVTAYFQTMNLLGEVIRLHEDAPTNFSNISTAMSYQIDFTDNPSKEEIETRKEKIKKLYNNDKVMNTTEYCIDCTGVTDTLESIQTLLLGITLIVVVLVTVLMERSFIADEKSQIAILKAIGFKDSMIIKWHVYRFGLVAFSAVIIAAILSVPMTEFCITPIFSMMGATNIDYCIDPLQIFVLYPSIVLIMTIFVAWITALYTKTIKSSETTNVE